MARNVEIKAKVSDLPKLRRRVESLADRGPALIEQEDTFFLCPSGRLKLRRFSDGTGELIFYQRPDGNGPRESQYFISATHDPRSLTTVLTGAYGVRGVVRKRRALFLAGQTRIHLDEVEDLGTFLELEVVLDEDQTAEEGTEIAQKFMKDLDIADTTLVPQAYIDLLDNEEKDKN
jgi:predicted adenylyl cyclase CyaB